VPRHRLTVNQKQQRQEWVSGSTGQTTKDRTKHITQFEMLISRLGLSEANCHTNAKVAAWCNRYKSHKFIPEMVLHRLSLETAFDGEPASFSLVNGIVLPEPKPLEEQEVEQHEHQTQ
jgi:hypothetical protein